MASNGAVGAWAPQQDGLLELVELFKKSQTAYGPGQAEIADVSRETTHEE
jgi:hypothetical protein